MAIYYIYYIYIIYTGLSKADFLVKRHYILLRKLLSRKFLRMWCIFKLQVSCKTSFSRKIVVKNFIKTSYKCLWEILRRKHYRERDHPCLTSELVGRISVTQCSPNALIQNSARHNLVVLLLFTWYIPLI